MKIIPTIRKRKTGGWYFFVLTYEHMFAIVENIRTDVRFNVNVRLLWELRNFISFSL